MFVVGVGIQKLYSTSTLTHIYIRFVCSNIETNIPETVFTKRFLNLIQYCLSFLAQVFCIYTSDGN